MRIKVIADGKEMYVACGPDGRYLTCKGSRYEQFATWEAAQEVRESNELMNLIQVFDSQVIVSIEKPIRELEITAKVKRALLDYAGTTGLYDFRNIAADLVANQTLKTADFGLPPGAPEITIEEVYAMLISNSEKVKSYDYDAYWSRL